MNNELYHYNRNHDRLGRFARSSGGGKYTKDSIYKRSKKLSDDQLIEYNKRANREKQYRKNQTEEYLASRGTRGAFIDNGQSMANNAKTSADAASNLARTLSNSKKSKNNTASIDAQKMSDVELRQAINRMDMERRYVSLKQSEISTGYDKASDILSTSGQILAIAGGALGVAASVKYLRHSELYHHGVKGQKWGVRKRSENQSASTMWRMQKAEHRDQLKRTKKQLKSQLRSNGNSSLTKDQYKTKVKSIRAQNSISRGKTLINGNQTYGKIVVKGLAKQAAVSFGALAVAGAASSAGMTNAVSIAAAMETPIHIIVGASDVRKLIDMHSYNTSRYGR